MELLGYSIIVWVYFVAGINIVVGICAIRVHGDNVLIALAHIFVLMGLY